MTTNSATSRPTVAAPRLGRRSTLSLLRVQARFIFGLTLSAARDDGAQSRALLMCDFTEGKLCRCAMTGKASATR